MNHQQQTPQEIARECFFGGDFDEGLYECFVDRLEAERATLTAAIAEERRKALKAAARCLDDLAATITGQARSEEATNIELARMLDHAAINISNGAFAVRSLASQPAQPG